MLSRFLPCCQKTATPGRFCSYPVRLTRSRTRREIGACRGADGAASPLLLRGWNSVADATRKLSKSVQSLSPGILEPLCGRYRVVLLHGRGGQQGSPSARPPGSLRGCLVAGEDSLLAKPIFRPVDREYLTVHKTQIVSLTHRITRMNADTDIAGAALPRTVDL